MRARAGKKRSGVRVKTDSETGERHTPHGRVEPASYAQNLTGEKGIRE